MPFNKDCKLVIKLHDNINLDRIEDSEYIKALDMLKGSRSVRVDVLMQGIDTGYNCRFTLSNVIKSPKNVTWNLHQQLLEVRAIYGLLYYEAHRMLQEAEGIGFLSHANSRKFICLQDFAQEAETDYAPIIHDKTWSIKTCYKWIYKRGRGVGVMAAKGILMAMAVVGEDRNARICLIERHGRFKIINVISPKSLKQPYGDDWNSKYRHPSYCLGGVARMLKRDKEVRPLFIKQINVKIEYKLVIYRLDNETRVIVRCRPQIGYHWTSTTFVEIKKCIKYRLSTDSNLKGLGLGFITNDCITIEVLEFTKENRSNCYYNGCNKEFIFDIFRCRGCKCTFYCSRSCAKKDWNEEHREICIPGLIRYYSSRNLGRYHFSSPLY